MRLLLLTFLIWGYSFAQTPPNAQFTGTPQTVCLGSPVSFINQSTQGTAAITSYSWDFGDGNSATTANTTHIYSSPGTYTVTLTVQASNGQADFELKNNYIVVNPSPTASYSASTNGCSLPVGVTFTNGSTGGSTYVWNFGNGQTSTVQNPPLVNYTTAGTYNVSLITTNSFGCKDTLIQPIVVSNFQAGITVPTTACQNTPVTISDNSTIGANSWSWTFNGGSPGTSSSQNNTITYTAPGTYSIGLTAQNTTLGCSGNTTASITILPTPVPSFTATPNSGCAPQAVTFTNTSPSGSNFVWNFGDGSTFNGQNPPPHNYTSNGSFSVTLSMTGSNGCVGTVTIPTITLTAPNAAFTSNVVNGCSPLSVQFTDASISTAPITNWLWDFGDGTTFNGQIPPVHVYPVGVYTVALTITTQGGCQGTITMPQYIQVGHIDLVNFSIDQTPECAKTNIDFTNLSVISAPHLPNEVTYFWDFGDGGTSTQENPGYSYSSDTGFFDVMLVVTFRGCKDTLIVQNAVYIKAPISRFTPSQTLFCNVGSSVTVTVNDNSIIGALPNDCSMTWKWGDGTFTNFDDIDFDDADKGTTTHLYNSGYNSYTIEQVIHNFTTGCSDSTTTVIHVSQAIAAISPLANDSVCVGINFLLDENSSTPNVHLPWSNFTWNMGNGQSVTGANPTYAYPSFGTYTITLTATNNVGCSGQTTFTPFTALANPVGVINASDNAGCAPFPVTFTNGSTSVNNGVPLSSFQFFFSDNNSFQNTNSVNTSVNHTFLTEGVFQVTLVATDQFGCVSAPVSTNITLTKPTATFSTDAVVCNNENFITTNTSTGVAPLGYQWFIDGSQTSTSTNFSHAFNETTPFTASNSPHVYSLIVTDGNGCKDTVTNPIVVSTPVAIIGYVLDGAATNANGDFLCPPVFANFIDSSLSFGNVVSYNWTFGDGKTSVLSSPSNTYVFPGTYTATLTIIDEYGCTADTTLLDYLTIFGPVADPSWTQNLTQCGSNVTFDIGNSSNVTNIIWNLDDGNTVQDSTQFVYSYNSVNIYNPSVTVFDSNNCQVIYPLNPITVPDNGLHALFSVSPSTEVELGVPVVFIDASTGANGILTWTWDLVNIPPFTNTNGSSVTSTYVGSGYFDVTLTITDQLGCINTYTVTIHVDGNFTMPNVITPNGDGVNDLFNFQYDIFKSFDMIIVNRWGNVVQELVGATGTTFWDCTNKGGQLVSDGVYFYKFNGTLKDGTNLKKDGFVQVFAN